MAHNGMNRIAAFLNTPGPAPAIAPEPSLVTLVSGRDDTPEGGQNLPPVQRPGSTGRQPGGGGRF